MQDNLFPFSILVIEDESSLRKQLVEILKFDFKNVYEASSAEMALGIYKDKKPDIMLVDINLPNISGLEFINEVRKNDHSTKAIVLTAHSEVEYLKKATSLKLTDYLIKPLSRKALREALNNAILEIKNFKVISNNVVQLKDNYSWDINEQTLFKEYEEIKLSALEKKLLNLFMKNQNVVLDFDTIIINLWDDYEIDKMNSLKTLIRKLRKKIPENCIENIYKEGYILRN